MDEKGNVNDVHVLRTDIIDSVTKEVEVKGYKTGDNPEIDPESVSDLEAEALRVVNLLGDFTPAQKDGKNVRSQFTMPIIFVLEEKE